MKNKRNAVLLTVASSVALTSQIMPAYSTPQVSESGVASPHCCSGSGSSLNIDEVMKEDFTFDVPEEGCDPVRFHQARYLIEESRDFISKAKALHEKIEKQILIAKTLKGEANMMMNQIPQAKPMKLQGKALQAATDEYKRSLQAFVNNADRYKFNLQTFRTTIGECQRAQAAYDRQRNQYQLHCDQFHVQGLSQVEPPHICGAVNVTEGEASHIAGQLRADEQRLRATMQELNHTGAMVQESRQMVAANLTNSATEAVRQREEEKLAKEFGRLKEEYELLKIQSNMLTPEKQREAGKFIKRSVSGSVVGK